MEIILNGQARIVDEQCTITKLLQEMAVTQERVVVEINFQIVAKEDYDRYTLQANDSVEVVSFVGGG